LRLRNEFQLDRMIPVRSSIMVLGEPGSGKTELALNLARRWLEQGERAIYVTTSMSGIELLKRVRGWKLQGRAQDVLRIVDCFDKNSANLEDPTVVYISSYSHLESITLAISTAAEALGTPLRIIVDGLSTLFLSNAPQTMAKFVQVLAMKSKLEYGSIVFTVVRGMHENITLNTMLTLVDGVIDIEMDRQLNRFLRVRYIKGQYTERKWLRYHIDDNGIELEPGNNAELAYIMQGRERNG